MARSIQSVPLILALLTGLPVAAVAQTPETLAECLAMISSKNWYGAADPCMAAANDGHADAQYHLGYLFEHGYGVEHSYSRAAHWWTMAADQGHSEAAAALSVYYEAGVGVESDMAEAFRLTEMAANSGSHTAQTRLGRFYLEGEAVVQSSMTAYFWLFIGKENGNQKAEQLLDQQRWDLSPRTIKHLERVGARCIVTDYQRCSTKIK